MAGGSQGEGVSEVSDDMQFTDEEFFVTELKQVRLPAPAGHWIIGGSFNVSVWHRPSRWNRFWTKLLLGWEWEEAPDGR